MGKGGEMWGVWGQRNDGGGGWKSNLSPDMNEE